MNPSREVEAFVCLFLEKYENVFNRDDLCALRDFVYYKAPHIKGKIPFIEMMSLIWSADRSVLKDTLDTEPISFGLLVDMLENATNRDFEYMKYQLEQYTNVALFA
ncbi:hypothetical protein [Alteribacillus bidgolensis]|uniref:Uncharacterized protein n=1 Tax=Alteribacillus bidgolensis TaxID=930129 RepID=A0A1G8KD12_9BACI|nr:hypothetical protein [Alteribacillus bidgolensis]SDI41335.1 hypothetical protein SAMN05216352_107172 [Alteribacillus bidgolensis]